jgi:release factor glutamine methyltransferase
MKHLEPPTMVEYHPLRSEDQNPTTAAYAKLNNDAERRAKECRSAKMPCLTHLGLRDFDNVYEPSDDTYLLIDAIGMDIDTMEAERYNQTEHEIIDNPNIEITLEIGCGTGVPTVYLAMRLRGVCEGNHQVVAEKEDEANANNHDNTKAKNSTHVTHFVTDINPEAIRVTKSTAEINGLPVSEVRAFQCDLASGILQQLENKVDILIFNPPYVPTPDEEVGSMGIEASWAGGINGRVVLDRALPQIARLLAFPHGVAYIVVVDDNYPEQIAQTMDDKYGIKVIPWLRRRARNEFLTILKMTTTRKFGSDERT